MKKSIFTAFVLATALNSYADCRDAYSNEIKRLDGMLNPARIGLATFGATSIAVPVTMAVVGATIAPVAVIGAPAAAFAAASAYSGIEIRKAVLRKTLLLIKNSVASKGMALESTTSKLQRSNANLTIEDVAAKVQEMNNSNALCPENPRTGKVKLFGILKARRMVAKNLTGETPAEIESEAELN